MIVIQHATSLDVEAVRDLIVHHNAAGGIVVPFGGISFEVTRTDGKHVPEHSVKAVMRVDVADAPLGTPTRMELDHMALTTLVLSFLNKATGRNVPPAMLRVDVLERRRTLRSQGFCLLKGFTILHCESIRHAADDLQLAA